MSGRADLFFVDTNVLLYSVDVSDMAKHERARKWMEALWSTASGRLSWQVLDEFYSNAVGKQGSAAARENVDALALWQPADFGLPLLHRAWYWSDQTGVAYWDSLIIAAAEATGCRYLLSEDFQAGQKFGEISVVHPFNADPAAYLT